jgi:hypothetical protein
MMPKELSRYASAWFRSLLRISTSYTARLAASLRPASRE